MSNDPAADTTTAPVATRTEPWTLTVAETGNIIGFACPACRIPHMLIHERNDESIACARSRAMQCCNPVRTCTDCGASFDDRPYNTCVECRNKFDALREQERFDKATKVTAAEYAGWVYWYGASDHNNGYFESTADLIDYCDDEGLDAPAYVWACDEIKFAIDADDVLEQALQEHHEDAGDKIIDKAGLETMLDEWAAKQTVKSYDRDTSRAVLMFTR